jgi:hypothetical protein
VAGFIGPYQASAGFSMRAWAATHGDVIERYVAGYVAALRWALDPSNRRVATKLLEDRLTISPALAARTYAAVTDAEHGVTRDARLVPAAFATTLALRAELETASATTPRPADRYLDLTWYGAALRRLPPPA